jgi:hypothetical protein
MVDVKRGLLRILRKQAVFAGFTGFTGSATYFLD